MRKLRPQHIQYSVISATRSNLQDFLMTSKKLNRIVQRLGFSYL